MDALDNSVRVFRRSLYDPVIRKLLGNSSPSDSPQPVQQSLAFAAVREGQRLWLSSARNRTDNVATESQSVHPIVPPLTTEHTTVQSQAQASVVVAAPSTKGTDAVQCSVCKCGFANAVAYRDHCKSAWHKHNQKLDRSGKPTVTEQSFHNRGSSDDEDSDNTNRRSSKPKKSGNNNNKTPNQKSAQRSPSSSDESPESTDSDASLSDNDTDNSNQMSLQGAPRVSFVASISGDQLSKFALPKDVTASTESDDQETKQSPESTSSDKFSSSSASYSSKRFEVSVNLWKNVLLGTDAEDQTDLSSSFDGYVKLLKDLPLDKNWAMFLSSGGELAAGVFQGEKCIKHTTMHRYTVRKKQGGVQMSRDSQGHAPKSIGSTIRRNQQKRLEEDIVSLLEEWREIISPEACSRIFVFAPSFNKRMLFFDGSPLARDDTRVRSVPFTVRRTNFTELRRLHRELSSCQVALLPTGTIRQLAEPKQTLSGLNNRNRLAPEPFETPLDTPSGRRSPGAPEPIKVFGAEQAEAAEDEKVEEEPEPKEFDPSQDTVLQAVIAGDVAKLEQLHATTSYHWPPTDSDAFQQDSLGAGPLVTAVGKGDEQVVQFLVQHGCRPVDRDGDEEEEEAPAAPANSSSAYTWSINIDYCDPKDFFRTALHKAAADGTASMVERLLEAGANPEIRCAKKQTAYNLSRDKDIRNVFRKFAGRNPDMWDYVVACIPPLTDDGELQAAQRLAQKKAKQKERAKAKAKEKKAREAEEEQKKVQLTAEKAKKEAELKAQAEVKSAAKQRNEAIKTMTDREKRAFALESRLAAAKGSAPPCANPRCGKPIMTVPFERLSFKYCTLACLQEHRKMLPED